MTSLVRYAAIVLFLVALSPRLLYAADPASDSYYSVQVGSVGEKARAQKLVRRLWSSGFSCTPVKSGYFYKVICGELDTRKEVASLKRKIRSMGFVDAFSVQVKGEGEFRSVAPLPSDDKKPDGDPTVEPAALVNSPVEFDALLSQVVNDSSHVIGAEIFGREGGYFHPFAGLSLMYTDNVLYTGADEKSELITTVNTGLWAVFPSWKGPVKDVVISGATPGGLREGTRLQSIAKGPQGFFMLRADHDMYSRYSSEDFTAIKGRAFLGYGTSKGHKLVLDNIYLSSRDPLQAGMFNGAGDFSSNRVTVRLGYRVSERLNFGLEHTNYNIDYPDQLSAHMNRRDTLSEARLDFEYSPKTTVLMIFRAIDVDYENPLKTDRTEMRYSLGLGWKVSGRTNGQLRYVRAENEYDGVATDGDDTTNRLTMDLSFRKSGKTAFRFLLTGSRIETDYLASDYISRTGGSARVGWAPTSKVMCSLRLTMQNDEFMLSQTGAPDALVREDDIYSVGTSLRFLLARHTAFTVNLTHRQRQSTLAPFEYDTNSLYAGVFVSF